MKRIFLTFATAALLVVAACSDKKNCGGNAVAAAPADSTQAAAAPAAAPVAQAVTLDGVSQLVGWETGPMKVTKNADEIVLSDADGYYQLKLKYEGDGVYQETSKKKDQMGQSAKFKVQKVGDVVTLSAFDGDILLFALVSFDNLKNFKDKGYKRILTSRFEPYQGRPVTITNDVMKGLPLPDCPDMTYFFIEDDRGGLSDKIRLSPGRYHLAFHAADNGVNLYFCGIKPETGELEEFTDDENIVSLRYAKDPGWPWLSTDVLDSDFIVFNFEKAWWKVMLAKLKERQQPTDIEQWNRALLENLIAHSDPFTGLDSTDPE